MQHSMKVVFLCNRLSRTKLRGSWQALLDASHGVESGSVVGKTEPKPEREVGEKEVSLCVGGVVCTAGIVWL